MSYNSAMQAVTPHNQQNDMKATHKQITEQEESQVCVHEIILSAHKLDHHELPPCWPILGPHISKSSRL